MIFRSRKKDRHEEEEEQQELELVLFQGALNGAAPNLKANVRLVQAGLMPAKELVSDALARRAEQMRVDPQGRAAVVRFFIDGVAYPGGRLPRQQAHAITQMLKLLSGLDIQQRKQKQSGGVKAQYRDTPYELYIQSEPTSAGLERLTVRARNLNVSLDTPDEIGIPDEMRTKIREMTCDRSGALLVCGPPGSGTTTTRFGIFRCVDAYQYQLYTICDLEGRELPYVTQFEVNPDDDLQATLQRVIRVEADVVMADPIRTAEDAQAIFASQKKITIISEFRAPDVVQGVLQLIKLVGDPQIVAEGLRGLISQKLVRVLCKECKQAFRPNPKIVQRLGLPRGTKILYRPTRETPEDRQDPEYRPCRRCDGLGYYGRTAMFEMLEMTDGMKKLVVSEPNAAAIKAQMRKEGMRTLQSEGLRLVAAGTTSLEELQRVFKKKA